MYKKKVKLSKPLLKRELKELERKLDYEFYIMEQLYNHNFANYAGKPSNRQLVAEYIKNLPFGTRFHNSNICRATGLSRQQIHNAKQNRFIKRALKVMQIDPNDKYSGWKKV